MHRNPPTARRRGIIAAIALVHLVRPVFVTFAEFSRRYLRLPDRSVISGGDEMPSVA